MVNDSNLTSQKTQ